MKNKKKEKHLSLLFHTSTPFELTRVSSAPVYAYHLRSTHLAAMWLYLFRSRLIEMDDLFNESDFFKPCLLTTNM